MSDHAKRMQELSEVERLKLENLNLKQFALEIQLQQVMAERARLIKQIEEDRPGWRWKEPNGFVWEGGSTAIPQ